jgi:putative aldouronate transport system permease protein
MVGVLYAFTDYGWSPEVSFIGLENFQRLFQAPQFWRALRNTLIISSMKLIILFPLPIILSLLMNEIPSIQTKRTVQFIVYIPHFFSWVVVGAFFVMLLSPVNGPINNLIRALGGEPIFFFANNRWFRWVLVVSDMWKNVGFGTVIYVATLSAVSRELYEAAIVDGANRWQQVWHISLPALFTTIAVVLLLNLANILKLFDQVLVMYNYAVYESSDVLSTYAFREGLQQNFDLGYATAVNVFVSVVSLLLVFGSDKAVKTVTGEGIL